MITVNFTKPSLNSDETVKILTESKFHPKASTVITMNCNLTKITYSTFRLLLLLKIHEAISPKGDVEVAKRSSEASIIAAYSRKLKGLQSKAILSRVKKSTSVAAYQSAIALQIAAQVRQNPTAIALEIVKFCGRSRPQSLVDSSFVQASLSDLTVSITETGFIEFEFGDRAVKAWLRSWLSGEFSRLIGDRATEPFRLNADVLNPDQVFFCQYAYARCESLLRVAESLGLEPMISDEFEPNLAEPSERALLFELVSVSDDGFDATAQACAKSAIVLAQAFEAFDRNCRIFGRHPITQPHLAQRRLALVMITQLLLSEILEQKLGVDLPDSL